MFHWIVLFIVSSSSSSSTVVGKTIVKENYEGSHDGWFEIQLKAKNPHLIHVEWCSELYKGASIDIDDCKAHNLIRKTIFPVPLAEQDVYDMVTKPGVLRLNPTKVSGFWLNRQTDVVIEMHEEDNVKRSIIQVVRINPPPFHAVSKEEVIEDEQQQPVPTPTPTPTPNEVTSETLHVDTTEVPFDFRSLGSGPIILLGLVVGVTFFVVGLALLRSKSKQEQEQPKSISPVYNFETNNGIDLLLSDEQEEEERRKKEEQKKQDQAFLLTLGKGANDAFFLNIK